MKQQGLAHRGLAALAWLAALAAANESRALALPPYTLSLQYRAMTSNAGGQEVYGLRLAHKDDWELALFSNQYLLTGPTPLTGVSYNWRFPICPRSCLVASFVELGLGASTAGPYTEILWNLTLLWMLRLDIVTHIYFPKPRPIVWSYPLWLGISIPF